MYGSSISAMPSSSLKNVLKRLAVLYALIYSFVAIGYYVKLGSHTHKEVALYKFSHSSTDDMSRILTTFIRSHDIWYDCGQLRACVLVREGASDINWFWYNYRPQLPIRSRIGMACMIDYINYWRNHSSATDRSNSTQIIFIDGCINRLLTVPTSSAYSDIYEYYDVVLDCARSIAIEFPKRLIAWSLPRQLLFENVTTDIRILHYHLIMKHVYGHGIIVPKLVLPLTDMIASTLSTVNHSTMSSSMRGLMELLSDQVNTIVRGLPIEELHGDLPVSCAGQFAIVVKYQHRLLMQNSFDGMHSIQSLCNQYIFNRRYHDFCHPPFAGQFPVLVTGLGGSGTHFVANYLRKLGWHIKHENLDQDGSVSWLYAVNDNATGLPYHYGALHSKHNAQWSSRVASGVLRGRTPLLVPAGWMRPRFQRVIQVVREPWAQISSFTAHSNKSYRFILESMRIIAANNHSIIRQFETAHAKTLLCPRGGNCHLHFAALSWLYWNRYIRSYADATYRIQDIGLIEAYLCNLFSSSLRRSASDIRTTKPHSPLERFCPIRRCPPPSLSQSPSNRHGESPYIRSIPSPSEYDGSDPGPVSLFFLYAFFKWAFSLLDRTLGVCDFHAALFQRSAVPKMHQKYNYRDVAMIDPVLAESIRTEAYAYGFQGF